VIAAGIALCGAAVGSAGLFGGRPWAAPWVQPPAVAVLYALAAAAAATGLWLSARSTGPHAGAGAAWALGLFTAATMIGPALNAQIAVAEHAGEAVAGLKRRMPAGVGLSSLGPVHHLFAYHYADPIALRPPPEMAGAEVPEWFCVTVEGPQRPALPFAWREEAAVSMDRKRSDRPRAVTVVGRRVGRE
jgi:hypothetical protein